MTAILLIRQSDAVHVLTDGGAFNITAAMVFQTVKTWPLVHLNAVLAVRGPALLLAVLATYASIKAPTYDELRHDMPDVAREALKMFDTSHHDFDIVVGGWSERTGPDGYVLTTQKDAGIAPWSVADAGTFFMTPSDTETLAKLRKMIAPGTSADNIDPSRDGLRVLEMQRGRFARIVGGHVTLTTVRRGAIDTRMLHRWAV